MEVSVRANGNAELVISKPTTRIQQAAFDTFVDAVKRGLAIRVTVDYDPQGPDSNDPTADQLVVCVEDFKS